MASRLMVDILQLYKQCTGMNESTLVGETSKCISWPRAQCIRTSGFRRFSVREWCKS